MANEKRLIDADALMDAFRSYMVERYDREKCVSEENCKTCEIGCLWRKMISSAPTVDAVEVVHGRWVGHYDGSWIHKRKWLTGYDCSVCGNFINTMTPYCPYCGAKMDGGNEDGC